MATVWPDNSDTGTSVLPLDERTLHRLLTPIIRHIGLIFIHSKGLDVRRNEITCSKDS